MISHGLWDDPESFEGWGEVLAAHGYTVLLPDHPGSDFNQQKAMLAGDAPPPGPEELRLRPLDVSALLDAICLLYTSPSPRDQRGSRMPSSA